MVSEAEVAELYRRYGHAIFRRALKLCGNEADAHELLQETFCQFCKNIERFAGRSSPFTYLYRIATNLSIDRLRRRTTAGDQVALDEGRDVAPGHGPERQALAVQQIAVLTAGLDEETLTIAVMAYVDGMTQDEIAAALDLSRRTVGKRLARFLAYTRGRAFTPLTAAVAEGGGDV